MARHEMRCFTRAVPVLCVTLRTGLWSGPFPFIRLSFKGCRRSTNHSWKNNLTDIRMVLVVVGRILTHYARLTFQRLARLFQWTNEHKRNRADDEYRQNQPEDYSLSIHPVKARRIFTTAEHSLSQTLAKVTCNTRRKKVLRTNRQLDAPRTVSVRDLSGFPTWASNWINVYRPKQNSCSTGQLFSVCAKRHSRPDDNSTQNGSAEPAIGQ